MSKTLDVWYEVKLDSALHCGSGFARGILDRAVVRDGSGDLYIPGSTIKGRTRHAAELLALRLDLGRPCSSSRPETMCRGASLCAVCLLFGSPAQGEKLFFDDCKLIPELRQGAFGEREKMTGQYRPHFQTWERTQVMLDRRRRVAAEGHLFSSEFGVPDLVFAGRISGRLPDTLPDSAVAPAAFLVAALCLVESLGGDRSRGVGHCRLRPQKITVDDKPDELASLLTSLVADARGS